MNSTIKNIHSIVIIDDDYDDFELVYEAIQEINPEIELHYVNNCDKAMELKNAPVDLVLLDINMPHHDGFYWLKNIRENGYKDLPIIMYTNSLAPSHIVRAYQEGANLYFSKPETFPNLIKGLKKLIQFDWSQPALVTGHYVEKGHFRVFQPD
ncbi:MAG: response regulator [Flavisolibacter sp.]